MSVSHRPPQCPGIGDASSQAQGKSGKVGGAKPCHTDEAKGLPVLMIRGSARFILQISFYVKSFQVRLWPMLIQYKLFDQSSRCFI